MLLQILGTIFVLFAMSRILFQFKEENVGWRQLSFWMIIWTSALVILYWPHSTDRLASYLGIGGRGIEVVAYAGIVLLFYLIYRSYIKMENIEREITKIVRNSALQDLKKE